MVRWHKDCWLHAHIAPTLAYEASRQGSCPQWFWVQPVQSILLRPACTVAQGARREGAHFSLAVDCQSRPYTGILLATKDLVTYCPSSEALGMVPASCRVDSTQ